MESKQVRLRLIKVIHVGRRELGMEDEDYRMMLGNIPALKGQTSTAKLSVPQLSAVVDVLKAKGFTVKPTGKSKGKPHNFASGAAPLSITKVEALLADMGLPWSYADSIANQMFGIDRCAWIRERKQLKALIAALHVEAEKRSLLARVVEALTTRGTSLEQFEEVQGLRAGWQRNRKKLKSILVALEETICE